MDTNEYKVCKEMLYQRNYTIVEENKDIIIALKDNNETLFVFFINTPKLNLNMVKSCVTQMEEEKVSHSIIVYKNTITPPVYKCINSLSKKTIELFSTEELGFNPTKHRLVPKHEKLPKEESRELLSKYKTNFPYLLITDPISRFYNYQKGDVIKITRQNGYVMYRLVK